MTAPGWVVVIPVKPAAVGKSRLLGAVDAAERADAAGRTDAGGHADAAGRTIAAAHRASASDDDHAGLPTPPLSAEPRRTAVARAIALDTIAAAAQVCPVIVVTDDVLTAAEAEALGAAVVGQGTRPGLNPAVAVGVAAAEASAPGAHRAALLGDLPALRPADLADALRRAASVPRAVVADAEGTGSTLVTARTDVPWTSRFGAHSLRLHVTLGCTALDLPHDSTLRRDVDTPDQLHQAMRLGLGPHTAALVPSLIPTPMPACM